MGLDMCCYILRTNLHQNNLGLHPGSLQRSSRLSHMPDTVTAVMTMTTSTRNVLIPMMNLRKFKN